ncbi:MAG: 3-oxoacyl-ACP reductase FabG [Xanthomonadaceae bacterium]|nr:3-oxoacyl-ACP reductase FabG [Xanthomonadaceae bacterium]
MEMTQKGVALVTGASRGIGAAIAKKLGSQGYLVGVHYRSGKSQAEAILSEIKTAGGKGFLISFNIGNPADITNTIEGMVKEYGPVAALVNNAGITGDALLMRQSNEQIDELLNVNLRGAIVCTRECVKSMIKAKNGGSIVFISSVVGETGNAGQSVYSATKSGLIGFAKSIAQEVASRKIRSNVVTPGFIKTDMTENLTDAQKESILRSIPLERMGEPEEVANAVAFLVGTDSRYITGEVIAVNGGMST